MIASDRRHGDPADSDRVALELAYAAARAAGLGVVPADDDDERPWVEVWCPCGAELSLRIRPWAPGAAAQTVQRFVGEHGHGKR